MLSRFQRGLWGLGASVLLGFPGLELLEQRFPVGIGRQFPDRRALLQEIVEAAAGYGFDPVAIEPFASAVGEHVSGEVPLAYVH